MTSLPDHVPLPFPILYEDNHLLAVVKPPEMPTMGAAPGTTSLVDLAKRYLKTKYAKPGNVYLGVVSRLDAPVTGVLLLARTSKAAERLTNQFRQRRIEKTYWAIVSGRVTPDCGECLDWVCKDEPHRRMAIASPAEPGAKQAELSYRLVRQLPAGSLLEIELHTGRKHQIRLQLSNIGHPIWGDKKYGSHRPFSHGIALHSRTLQLTHPTLKQQLTFQSPPPKSWDRFSLDV
jgi:23S rRNA pseudouridine1911/1915/1917 synthase